MPQQTDIKQINKVTGMRVCPECDLVHENIDLKSGTSAYCQRCGKLLYRASNHTLDKPLAFALAGIAFFIVACLFPVLNFSMQGNTQTNQLYDGGMAFLQTPYWPLGILVLFASVIAPFLLLTSMIVMLLPLKMGKLPPYHRTLYRLFLSLKPWAMAEIFVIGLMVAYVKLSDFASVSVGVSLAGFILMVLCSVVALMSLDPVSLWQRKEEIKSR